MFWLTVLAVVSLALVLWGGALINRRLREYRRVRRQNRERFAAELAAAVRPPGGGSDGAPP